MVGLTKTGFPLANQPFVNLATGQLTQSSLQFLQNLWNNATATTLPSGVTLPPGSVGPGSFQPFLAPVGFGETLPDPKTYSSTTPLFFQESDGQLYRLVNGAWTAAIPAINITGTITAAQLAQYSVTADKLASGAVGAPNIQAGAVGAVAISVTSLSAISANLGTVTAGTLTAGTSYLGVVSAGQISTTSLSAISANLGTITAGTINGITIIGSTVETATSGARMTMSPGVFLTGYNSAGVATINASPDLLSDNGSFYVTDSAGVEIGGLGASGGGSVFGRATGTSGNNYGGEFVGLNSSSDAIYCFTGGITIANGYLAMGSGNITGVGTNLTSTASTLFLTAGTNITHVANMLPNADNTYSHGNSSFRLSVVYSAGGVVTTSDERMKKDIEPEILGLSFINSLTPVSYRFDTDDDDAPVRHGLIAQAVQTALNGASFAGLHLPAQAVIPEGMEGGCSIDGATPFGLNYTEFLSPIILAIQQVDAKIEALKQQIAKT